MDITQFNIISEKKECQLKTYNKFNFTIKCVIQISSYSITTKNKKQEKNYQVVYFFFKLFTSSFIDIILLT